MIDYQLFLGFPLDSAYLIHLDQIPSALKALFIQDHSNYLQQIEIDKRVYLGKYLQPLIELGELELVAANIYSLLQRLVADYPYTESGLKLLAVSMPVAHLVNTLR